MLILNSLSEGQEAFELPPGISHLCNLILPHWHLHYEVPFWSPFAACSHQGPILANEPTAAGSTSHAASCLGAILAARRSAAAAWSRISQPAGPGVSPTSTLTHSYQQHCDKKHAAHIQDNPGASSTADQEGLYCWSPQVSSIRPLL